MCGLIFSYRPDAGQDTLREQATRALDRITHRGPDEGGIHANHNLVAGHRRLSILDLQSSRQPMFAADQRYVLCYNGEIYNFRELKAALSEHWQFRTEGDTEVLLAGLVVHGPRFLERMEGMWAFAFWDEQRRTLLLSRDRMGKKPLFYRGRGRELCCASELPALRCLGSEIWEEDADSSADFLQYGYYLPGTTAYRRVHEVLPGHYLLWSPGDAPVEHPYWSLRTDRYAGTRVQAAEAVRDGFQASVSRRMVADVEVGAFLSGGIDSSLVTAVMSTHCGVSPRTFTIGFDEAAYDEREYARMVAKRYRTRHHEECLQSWNADRLKTLVLRHMGQPFSDSSLLPTALVSELAGRHVKVALSGDGGDELFAGYYRYKARTMLRWYTRLPRCLRNRVSRVVPGLPEAGSGWFQSLLRKIQLFVDVTDRMACESPYIAPLNYSRSVFSALSPDLAGRGHEAGLLPAETSLDDIQSMMLADALVYLPQDVLVKVDRASMAHSLEVRAPFLDSGLVELAFSLPREWHYHGLSGKHMLRQSFSGLLPECLWNRRKQGFGVPIHRWFREGLGEELEQYLRVHQGPLQTGFVHGMLESHRSGRRDHGYRLWNIYVYLLWHSQLAAVGS